MKAQTRTKLFKYFLSGLGRDDSDTENVEGGMVPAAKLAEVEKKCHDLTKQLKVHYLSTHCTKLMLTMDLSQTPFFLIRILHSANSLQGKQNFEYPA